MTRPAVGETKGGRVIWQRERERQREDGRGRMREREKKTRLGECRERQGIRRRWEGKEGMAREIIQGDQSKGKGAKGRYAGEEKVRGGSWGGKGEVGEAWRGITCTNEGHGGA